MVAQPQDGHPSYEQALRVIGRHLDAEPSYHVSILEVEDGFVVRYFTAQHRTDSRSVHFTWERLNDLLVFQTAGRRVGSRRHRHEGMWAKFPNGHQDFFRALGHTLDEEHASNLSVEEVDEGVQVSYVCKDPSNRLVSQKTHQLMKMADIQAALEAAQARRGKSVYPVTG
jgi:hypothetical protein